MKSTSPTATPTTAATSTSPSPSSKNEPTLFQLSLGVLIIGTSAGLTLYTKKTQALLTQFKRVEQNVKRREELSGKKKILGPLTKDEWEKVRNRWNDKDDI